MKSTFTVEKYALEDLRGIAEIEKECFEKPWSYESFCMEYADKNKFYFVAKDESGKVIGYGGYAHILDEGHIMNIAVTSSHRGQGVARAIVARMLGSARENGISALTLEVNENNAPAIKLYESVGFTYSGTRKHYYGWGIGARIYWYYL